MKRILIIGNAGAGKTTFAKALAKKACLPLIHLDQLYWQGNWETVSREEFDHKLQAELEKPEWIIDGNFSRTLPHRLNYCDTLFYLDYPTWVCLAGITKRIFTYWGKSRPDMGGNCPERFDKNKLSLYKGVLQYNRRHRAAYQKLLQEAKSVNVITFRSRKQAKNYLSGIS